MVIFEVNLSSIFYLLINLKKTDLMNLGYIINFSNYIFLKIAELNTISSANA